MLLPEIAKYETPNLEKKPSSLRYYQEGVPAVDADKWGLKIVSLDGRSLTLSYAELLSLPQTTYFRRIVCVCNWTIKRQWTGVTLKDLLDAFSINVHPCANVFIKQSSIGTAEKGIYESWVNLADALERGALLAYAVDGEALPEEQGYPIRFIDFGLYNYKNVKGLARIELTTEARLGHWEELAGYPLDGTIKPKRYWSVDLRKHMFAATPGEVREW